MDKIPKLGELITEPQHRDAVHIAVAPVVASEKLRPGDRIGLVDAEGAYHVGKKTKNILGIVDPFLTEPVEVGQEFYMFLMPNTITSLRHEWTHPAFEDEDSFAAASATFQKLKEGPEKKWMIDYANSIGVDYDELMEAADDYQSSGQYLCRGGDLEGMSTPREFWDNYDAIRKTKAHDRSNFFTCSC